MNLILMKITKIIKIAKIIKMKRTIKTKNIKIILIRLIILIMTSFYKKIKMNNSKMIKFSNKIKSRLKIKNLYQKNLL
jgi:hypothetical protein